MAPLQAQLNTPLTKLLRCQHPIMLAGMAHVSSGVLAAAVSNAGGFGVIGGFSYTPEQLRQHVSDLKENLTSTGAQNGFGIDLAIPQIGGNARKTNHDYTGGRLDELIDLVIESGARLFVCAIGIPPPHVVKRLHDKDILIMNMVGHPKHARKAFKAGVDMVCAQGGEGGGHTGDIASSILIPAVVDAAKKYKSPLTGQPALVVAAGGICDGRGLAAALMQGAAGVWVGTRFVASVEAGCSKLHKQAVVESTFEDTVRTLVISGRPLRAKANDYLRSWARSDKQGELAELLEKGIVPYERDLDAGLDEAEHPYLEGQVAAVIDEIKPAAEIVRDMVAEAVEMIKTGNAYATRARQHESKL